MPKARKTTRKTTTRGRTKRTTGTPSVAPKSRKRRIEQYEHKDKQRKDNPPVGLVTARTDVDGPRKQYAYDPHRDPELVWAGKAERLSFEVDTVSLHVHERIDPRTIIEAVRRQNGAPAIVQGSLFEKASENPPLRDAIDFYKHAHGWSNRLIAGDSLLVMNSLLEKEGMAGQVQMIYLDPPYGIKYGSNFQPFVNKREVKDGKDDDLTGEPEQIRAFRDTWELGIHSYLTYLRDRLLLARELLTEGGSIFVQISDENVHHVRELLEEVFRARNFVNLITFAKTSNQTTELISSVSDYLLWFAKDRERLKFRKLLIEKIVGGVGADAYNRVELPDGRRMTLSDAISRKEVLVGARPYRLSDLRSQRPPGDFPVEFQGKQYRPTKG
jgi:adenine-specific DNA-methyltransferase